MSLILEAKEELVVDTQQGRIGFRHHKTPNRVGQGADWGAGGGIYEGKPGMGAGATELSRLNLRDRGGSGYMRVQS